MDIDPQAVEVTKLSLLLKVLEGETSETLGSTLRLFHERALPDLDRNIKCGNSLIGPDFYEGQQLDLFDEEERLRINVFDWHAEFPEVFGARGSGSGIRGSGSGARGSGSGTRGSGSGTRDSGHRPRPPTPAPESRPPSPDSGFDALIGNPPWGADFANPERKYLGHHYPFVADFESAQYFLSRAESLMAPRGCLGFIVPNTFALNVYAARFRRHLISRRPVRLLVDISNVDVFAGPNVRSMIVVLAPSTDAVIVGHWQYASQQPCHVRHVAQTQLEECETWKQFLQAPNPVTELIQRLEKASATLSAYSEVRQGYIPYRTTTLTRRFGAKRAGELVKGRLWHSDARLGEEYQKELQGADVNRYVLNWSGTWVKYGEWVSTFLPLSVFSGPRLLIREITAKLPRALLATYTEDVYVHNPSVLAVLPYSGEVSAKCVLGVLNSRLMSLIFHHVAPKATKGLFPKVIITDARRLFVPRLNLDDSRDRNAHDRMVRLVDQMLGLHQQLAAAKTPDVKTALQRQIDATDHQIDRLVYELYGLTEEEIRIVEEATPK